MSALALLAEIIVAAPACLAEGSDLRLHRGFVAALAHGSQLRRLVLEPLGGLLELARLFPYRGKRGALLALGAWIETVPRHLAQHLEVAGIALDGTLVVRNLALRHSGQGPEILALQCHDGLALLHQNLGFSLCNGIEGEHRRDRRDKRCCCELAVHFFSPQGGWTAFLSEQRRAMAIPAASAI